MKECFRQRFERSYQQSAFENRVTSAENKLNEIVYELYGITSKKEIDLIEQNL